VATKQFEELLTCGKLTSAAGSRGRRQVKARSLKKWGLKKRRVFESLLREARIEKRYKQK
jgi:hypothetical protein